MKLPEILSALREYRQLIDNAINGLVPLCGANGDITVIASTAFLPPPAPKKPASLKPRREPLRIATREPQQPAAAAELQACTKHPGGKLNRRGECKRCVQADYAREWARKNKSSRKSRPPKEPTEMRVVPKQTANDADSKLSQLADANRPKEVAAPRSEFADDLEYSKPVMCPKCRSTNTRFSRPEDVDKATGNWTCLKNGCQVRVSHIVLSVDHKYEPDVA